MLFNAWRAGMLAEMLVTLQKEAALEKMRYDIRLFVPNAEAPGVGEALGDLLSPGKERTSKEADAFSVSTGSHLWPKLRLAIRPIKEFREDADEHSAHLSMLFDVYPHGGNRSRAGYNGGDACPDLWPRPRFQDDLYGG